jgi:hypothetical protein
MLRKFHCDYNSPFFFYLDNTDEWFVCFSILKVAVRALCFNNNQRTWQKRLIGHQQMLLIGAGCI